MVFQNYALYPHLTAFDNIAFPLRLKRRNLGAEQIRMMVERTAASLGISALLGRRPSELSGGQRQRVALGRALVRQPRVFLLDEPLSNLDNQLRVEMRSELKELHDRVGATMIYVTHDQAEAMIVSDRVVVMRDGRVQQVGKPFDLYREPANVFVAGFLGERGMNLIPGSVESDRRRQHLHRTGRQVRACLTDAGDRWHRPRGVAGGPDDPPSGGCPHDRSGPDHGADGRSRLRQGRHRRRDRDSICTTGLPSSAAESSSASGSCPGKPSGSSTARPASRSTMADAKIHEGMKPDSVERVRWLRGTDDPPPDRVELAAGHVRAGPRRRGPPRRPSRRRAARRPRLRRGPRPRLGHDPRGHLRPRRATRRTRPSR